MSDHSNTVRFGSLLWILATFIEITVTKQLYVDEICGRITGQRIYLEFGESGTLVGDSNLPANKTVAVNKTSDLATRKCFVEFTTCPSCILKIQFKFMNISRTCKSTVIDSCGCDYIWIYEPQFQQSSGEQFCGHFVATANATTSLSYISQTRHVAINFFYHQEYEYAFDLDYRSERNRIFLTGYPKYGIVNHSNQTISSPFFPDFYPTDLSIEHVINCKSAEKCRISLIFTDFQVADSSIIEFFDWNGQRMYVTTGNIFRPPVITSSGPTLVVRFYANGSSKFGYKGAYTFLLGDLNDTDIIPHIDCGGYVNNLGGGITMMQMVAEGTKLFNCVWLVKPDDRHKTHLYVKLISFGNFAGNTELIIRQGLTSNEAAVVVVKYPTAHFYIVRRKEHVVPISEGFYVSLKGLFQPDSHLAIVYAAFNYKDCFTGFDFLCHNLRCISNLLNCDGFDHCGDNSDELSNCSEELHDQRHRSNAVPNFLFPKIGGYSDFSSVTLILLFSFGLFGLIFALVALLYGFNLKNRHQIQLQSHIETIHAILEESITDMDEHNMLTVFDEPPDYEAPPDYEDAVKVSGVVQTCRVDTIRLFLSTQSNLQQSSGNNHSLAEQIPVDSTSKACCSLDAVPQTVVDECSPGTPPPAYSNFKSSPQTMEAIIRRNDNQHEEPGPSNAGAFHLRRRSYSCDGIKTPSMPRNRQMTRRTLSLFGFSKSTLVKYFSDSELFGLEHIRKVLGRGRFSKLRKSFSSADMSSLL